LAFSRPEEETVELTASSKHPDRWRTAKLQIQRNCRHSRATAKVLADWSGQSYVRQDTQGWKAYMAPSVNAVRTGPHRETGRPSAYLIEGQLKEVPRKAESR